MGSVTFPNGTVFTTNGLTPDTPGAPGTMSALFQPLVASILGYDPIANTAAAAYASRIGWAGDGQPAWLITDNVCCITSTMEDDAFAKVRDSLPVSSSGVTTDGWTNVWKIHFYVYGPLASFNANLLVSAFQFQWVKDWLSSCITGGTVAAGGSGYQVGDVVTVTQAPAWGGELQVTAIGAGGAVTGFIPMPGAQGLGYSTASALPTTGGHGTGFTANISVSNIYAFGEYPRPVYTGELFSGQWWKRADIDMCFNERVIETTQIPLATAANVEIITQTGFTDFITVEF